MLRQPVLACLTTPLAAKNRKTMEPVSQTKGAASSSAFAVRSMLCARKITSVR